MKDSWNEIKTNLDKIYGALCDEESRRLFEARVAYMFDQNSEDYVDRVYRLNEDFPKNWSCRELERLLKEGQEIIIYGCGHDGKILRRELELCGYSAAYWCAGREKRFGTYVEGLKVLSPEELAKKHPESLVIIGSRKYGPEIRQRLFDVAFPVQQIFQFAFPEGVGENGTQYYDVFLPGEQEVFVDAGTYNGDSLEGFLQWVNGREYKAYAFETSPYMCSLIKAKNIPNVEVHNRAVWNCEEALTSTEPSRGSSVVGTGEDASFTLYGTTIDSVAAGEKVTFIKMDIEGAELQALEGAKETIVHCRPRLAICIYHKPTDIYDIGKYILELNPGYKLYIRHYSTCTGETVLYAVDSCGRR